MKLEMNENEDFTISISKEEFFKCFEPDAISSESSSTQAESKDETKDITDIRAEVTNILSRIGVPRSLKGFLFLREAIMLSVSDRSYVEHITKELYPAVAKKFQTTPPKTERSIRHAIEVVFSRGNAEILDDTFRYSVNPASGKVTNSEFIATIADDLNLKGW